MRDATIFYVSNLALGPVLVAWAWALCARHRHAFLQPFKWYLLLWVVFDFLFYVGQYSLQQVPGLDSRDRYLVYQMAAVLPVPVWSLFLYLFLEWTGKLVRWPRQAGLTRVFWAVQVLLLAGTVAQVVVAVPEDERGLDLLLGRLLDWAYHLQLVLAPLVLLVGARRVENPYRRLARRLGLTYIACFLVPTALVLSGVVFAEGVERFLAWQSVVFLAVNVPPLAMLHRFLGGHPPGPAGDDLPVSVTATIREMDLNRREGEIAALVARGLTNDEIAAELFVSVKTVKNNVSSVYRKTGLRNRVELANFLQRRGEG